MLLDSNKELAFVFVISRKIIELPEQIRFEVSLASFREEIELAFKAASTGHIATRNTTGNTEKNTVT